MPDRQLQRDTSRFTTAGGRWVAFGLSGVVTGLVIFFIGLALAGWLEILGLTIAILCALGALVGVSLLLSAAVTGWAARHRPFA